MFSDYLAGWGLVPDGDPIRTPSSELLPVRHRGVPAMLKVAVTAEEKAGARVMSWWDGEGAARVLARDDDAILLERAEGRVSLADLVHGGHDSEASRIICAVVMKLHAPKAKPTPSLIPLTRWFRALDQAAGAHGGVLAISAQMANELLASPRDVRGPHGDIHHGNILNFAERGWLAIDPKGVVGERNFDYANLFCNPDHETATASGRLSRQIHIVADAAGLEHGRLLRWVLAWAGLSAAWHLEDGTRPETALMVGEIAAAELHA